MEPVTAFGLAAGILQFVQFSSNIFKAAYGSYQALQRDDVDGICERLKELSHELDASLQSAAGSLSHQGQQPLIPCHHESREEILLRELAKSCLQDCEKLVSRLGKLRSRSGPRQFWASFKDALNGSLSSEKDSLPQIQDRIKQHESTLTVHMCAVMIKSGKHLQRQINKLILVNQSSASSTDSRLVSLDVDVTKALELVQQLTESLHDEADASRKMVGLAVKLKGLSLDMIRFKDSQKMEYILASLDYPQRSARHETIPEAHAETFRWALTRPETRPLEIGEAQSNNDKSPQRGNLLEWLEHEKGIFWVSGKPGSGKSTFMKYVADHPATGWSLKSWAAATGQSIVVMSHYFWSPGSQIQKSQLGLWRSLLLDLLRQAPDLTPVLCEELWKELDDAHDPGYRWSLSTLQQSLECFAKLSQSKHRSCIFIDGLDEYDGDHYDMVDTLLRLSKSSHVKLCIASRQWNVFEAGFGGDDRPKIYIQDLSHQDILNFTRSRLGWRSENTWEHSITTDERERLIATITNQAQGVFLWVFLVTKYLREGLLEGNTFFSLQGMLHTFPLDLELLFEQILGSVTRFYHCQMAGLLRLSLVAQRPLNFMVYYFHDKEHDDIKFVAKTPVSHLHEDTVAVLRRRMAMRLNDLCKGLLEINRFDEVQFIHSTVRDWLMSGPVETYLKKKSRADWDGATSLLQCHLGWYKCPTDHNLVSKPLNSALSYRNLICEYNELNGTRTINRILDDYLSVTMELENLGFPLNNGEKLEPRNTTSLTSFKIRLFRFGLWDYLSLKLDQDPKFLDILVRLPLQMGYLPGGGPDPWSDREASVRSKVAASLQASLLRQNTAGSTTDISSLILELECNQAEIVTGTLRTLLRIGSEPNPSHALTHLQSHGLPGFLISLFLTGYDGADLFEWHSYLMTQLRTSRGHHVWSVLCEQVSNLPLWPETDGMAAADFLRFLISEYLRARHPWPPPGSLWVELHGAIRNGLCDKWESESQSLTLLLEQNGLVGATPQLPIRPQTPIVPFGQPTMMNSTQVLGGRYLKIEAVNRMLRHILGEERPYSIEDFDGVVEINTPRRLTTGELYAIENAARCDWARYEDAEAADGVDDVSPSVDSVPLYDPSGVSVLWEDENDPGFAKLRFDYNLTHKSAERYHHFKMLDEGGTAEVYSVKAEMMSSRDNSKRVPKHRGDLVVKVAIKRLKTSSALQFRHEHSALRKATSINHPNIVQYLGPFRRQERWRPRFHFIFPQAFGNLKRLFRGDYRHESTIRRSRDSLWTQYAGLASALAYLHGSLNMAHCDIRPSNILIYPFKPPNSTKEQLALKIADFGLSVDLGLTKESMAGNNNPTVSTYRPFNTGSIETIRVPSPKTLLSADIWQLGCLFTQITAYLTRGGSIGVLEFRRLITKTESNVLSDHFNDTRFEDGERVKLEVLQWLEVTSRLDYRARQMEPLLRKMLSNFADRPTAEEVLSSFLDFDFSGLSYFDGDRVISLIENRSTTQLSHFDQGRLAVEDWLGQPVDWYPFPQVERACGPGESIASWRLEGDKLEVVLSKRETESLRAGCIPVLWDNTTPGLPSQSRQRPIGEEILGSTLQIQHRRQVTSTANFTTSGGHGGVLGFDSHEARTGLSAWLTGLGRSFDGLPQWLARMISSLIRALRYSRPRKQERGENQTFRQIFCCVDRGYTVLPTKVLQIIIREDLNNDKDFYEAFRKAIKDAAGRQPAGWLRRLFSWKICMAVDFVEFLRVDDVLVGNLRVPRLPEQPEQPAQPAPVWTHDIVLPASVTAGLTEIECIEFTTKFYGAEMTRKLRNPGCTRGVIDIIRRLPQVEGPLSSEVYTRGWGIYPSMGFSFWKFFWWLIAWEIISVVFCIVWIWYRGDTQLTAAVVPGTVVMTVFSLLNGMSQRLETR